jgi:hypothetical protein
MTANEAAVQHTDLVNAWNAYGPKAAYARVDALTRDELETLVMLHVGADALRREG